jgi:ribonucleoside-triphosphate reductase
MDKAGFSYEKLMADENADLAKQYGVKQAPTLVITDGVNVQKIAGAGAIKQYVSQ